VAVGAFSVNLTGKAPMGFKKPKPERGTKRAKAYIEQVKQLPCVICGRSGPSDAHHIICERYGSAKTSDFDVIPLCKEHHQVGPDAIHNGKSSWVAKYGNDFDYIETVQNQLKG